jgi:hypothetical protein
MADNPAVPSSVGRRLETACQSCGKRGVTIRGIDDLRRLAIVQCDTCGKLASLDSNLIRPDEVVD